MSNQAPSTDPAHQGGSRRGEEQRPARPQRLEGFEGMNYEQHRGPYRPYRQGEGNGSEKENDGEHGRP